MQPAASRHLELRALAVRAVRLRVRIRVDNGARDCHWGSLASPSLSAVTLVVLLKHL
jgi:hypothetical protein